MRNATATVAPLAVAPPVTVTTFNPSPKQAAFFDFVQRGRGSAVLLAVAGSGKSTTIVQSLRFIPEGESVAVLAFNSAIAAEMRDKIAKLGSEIGRAFKGMRAMTFHSMGFNAICYKMNVKSFQVKTDSRKLRTLFEDFYSEEVQDLYGSFVTKLVALAKGQGIGVLMPNEPHQWLALVDHHDLQLESIDADIDEAIVIARELLDHSNRVAKERMWIDFDDQLYLPLLWRCRLFPQSWVFIDEAQDTNPVRRALAKLALKPGGRLVAVGDPKQAIYGFVGASHDAIDLITQEFNCVKLPLTVSYRCPKAVGSIARQYVPYFEVHENAPEGEVLNIGLEAALKLLTSDDAILCRNTRPLVELAYQLLAKKVACHVLGSEIGKGLVVLVRKMKAKNLDKLADKLGQYRDREVAKFMAKGEEGRAEAVTDRVECVFTFIAALDENSRTIAALISNIEALFTDKGNNVLTLSTVHKAKGREWQNVAILMPDLMPSKWARQDWQVAQEENLIYVAVTRAQQRLIYLGADASDTAEQGAGQ